MKPCAFVRILGDVVRITVDIVRIIINKVYSEI